MDNDDDEEEQEKEENEVKEENAPAQVKVGFMDFGRIEQVGGLTLHMTHLSSWALEKCSHCVRI